MNTRTAYLAQQNDPDAAAALEREALRHGAITTIERAVDVILAAIQAEDEELLVPVFEALELDDWQREQLTWLLEVDDRDAWPVGGLDEDSEDEEIADAIEETREAVSKRLAPWWRREVFSQVDVDAVVREAEAAGWDATWREAGQVSPYWQLASPDGATRVSVWWDTYAGREYSGWCWQQTSRVDVVGIDGEIYTDWSDETSYPLDSIDELREMLGIAEEGK